MSNNQKKFADLVTYLGQIEYNLTNARQTVQNLEYEHDSVINELRQLESNIESDPSEETTETETTN